MEVADGRFPLSFLNIDIAKLVARGEQTWRQVQRSAKRCLGLIPVPSFPVNRAETQMQVWQFRRQLNRRFIFRYGVGSFVLVSVVFGHYLMQTRGVGTQPGYLAKCRIPQRLPGCGLSILEGSLAELGFRELVPVRLQSSLLLAQPVCDLPITSFREPG